MDAPLLKITAFGLDDYAHFTVLNAQPQPYYLNNIHATVLSSW